mgnify:CR=1 FL=1
MIIQKGRYVFGLLAAMLLLVLAACSPSTGTSSNGTSSLTVAQVLQNATTKMQQLKSVHFVTNVKGNVQASGSSSSTSNSVTFALTGNGDEMMPDSERLQVALNPSMSLSEIVLGNKVYIQNTKGQWYVIDKDTLASYTGNPFNGINMPDTNQMLAIAESAQITDHGDQSLNGATLRHITVTFDKASFKQFLTNNDQLKGLLGKQDIAPIIDNTKSFLATLDLWIDEGTSYLHRTELKFNLDANLSSLSSMVTPTTGTVPSNVTTNVDSIVDLSQFDAPITITPPSNAIPTNNPMAIFQG